MMINNRLSLILKLRSKLTEIEDFGESMLSLKIKMFSFVVKMKFILFYFNFEIIEFHWILFSIN